MYKLVAFAALLAVVVASPGLVAPIASPWGHGLVGGHAVVSAPIISAPIVKQAVPVATSYANTVRIASPAVVAAHAPIVAAHAPVLAAPLGHGLAHGW
ncbi:larval/pupal cuticle protein H1C-like [Nymphalis io]|uniref:larval/pupal cuticle protein H1C-like n=1 Tax=Inachis io TaxID=171585 RepID=UPI002167B5AE|nr:larval/pupal cuticle protein H1C-like [Nymphalis io]